MLIDLSKDINKHRTGATGKEEMDSEDGKKEVVVVEDGKVVDEEVGDEEDPLCYSWKTSETLGVQSAQENDYTKAIEVFLRCVLCKKNLELYRLIIIESINNHLSTHLIALK